MYLVTCPYPNSYVVGSLIFLLSYQTLTVVNYTAKKCLWNWPQLEKFGKIERSDEIEEEIEETEEEEKIKEEEQAEIKMEIETQEGAETEEETDSEEEEESAEEEDKEVREGQRDENVHNRCRSHKHSLTRFTANLDILLLKWKWVLTLKSRAREFTNQVCIKYEKYGQNYY